MDILVTPLILLISTHLNLSLLLQVLEPFIYFFSKISCLEFFQQFRQNFPPSSSSKNIQISEVFLCLNQ